ncbi:MAG: sulfite exporter TauE/SafE family protein [Candidatus Lokiarchaeota archaeon]|nr:sulfite exporter TauE/SafE family protein [Candidatus Lokiarchaeota archaeon]
MVQEYLVIFLPAFLLGILHTAIPCEDKAIFFFWSVGIAKTPTKSIYILALYGLGLICANMIIASITVLITQVPRFVFPAFTPDPHVINFFGAFSSMFAGIVILFFLTRRDYLPHSKYSQEIPTLDWERKKTPYFFGILAGFAPCIFDLIIYTQSFQFSLGYGFIEGLLVVFYFSLGTFVGLFPFALAKYGTSQMVKPNDKRRKVIFFLMIIIIIAFNSVVMILSFLRISVFPIEGL